MRINTAKIYSVEIASSKDGSLKVFPHHIFKFGYYYYYDACG